MKPTLGSKQTVIYNGATYDTYDNWSDIAKVPKFQLGAIPEDGKEYTVTHVGNHDCGLELYVLDEEFIVHGEAFLTPEFHMSQDQILKLHLGEDYEFLLPFRD